MAKRILVIGSAGIDLILNMRRIPSVDEILTESSTYCMIPGGNGSEAAVALGKLGASVAFCARLGADSHGQRLASLYHELEIDTACLSIDKTGNTAFRTLMVEENGNTRTVSYPGASANLSRGDIENAFATQPDGLFLSFDIPFELVRFASELADSRGIPVFLNASPATPEVNIDTLPPVEIFCVNEDEIHAYTGLTVSGLDSFLRAGLELSRHVKAKYYVFKLGSRGAYLYDGRFCHLSPAYPVRKIVDTAGAGIAFTAAMTAEYLRNGGMIQDACRYANAAAALTMQKAGAASSVPSHNEVAEFVETHPAP